MRCADLAERLTELLEGSLSEDEDAAAVEHLASCPSCEAVLAETRDVVGMVLDHGRVALIDADRSAMLSSLLGAVDESAGG